MRAKELRERSDEELKNLLMEAKDKLFKDRIKNATHQLTDSSQLKKNRREVARINTILGERASQIAEQE
ncbi:MAG: 50S ribosomal protein L29 [Deltaproteobacteria bacterium]|nr:50S ribosomal protein L29 [Deltaproteobacteria bacterium]